MVINSRRIPGGSAANVATCFSRLSGEPDCVAYFTGMLGDDGPGMMYVDMMRRSGVDVSLILSHESDPTGICLCLVTPDGQRTMRTCLKASFGFTKLPKGFQDVRPRLTHFEGYAVYRGEHTLEAMRDLRKLGSMISFDFASFEVVEACLDVIKSILEEKLLDVLFCNEDEAYAFAEIMSMEKTLENIINIMCNTHNIVMVISRGAKGCIAGSIQDGVQYATADEVKVVDTIGAGDYFTAGFLYTWLNSTSVKKAAEFGCLCGSEAVQAEGAVLSEKQILKLRQSLPGFLQ